MQNLSFPTASSAQSNGITSLRNLPAEGQDNLADRRILIFELSVGGHYPEYISHLVSFWCEQRLPGCLYIVVVPEFLSRHADVVAIASKQPTSPNQVHFIPLTPEERANLKPYGSGINRNLRAWQEFSLINQYARQLQVDRIFLPYLDTRMLPLALGKSLPCPFSGIYFRPSFHYPSFCPHRLSWKEKIQHIREKITLSRVLRQPQLTTLYSLDPFAVEQINQLSKLPKAKPLPDPVKIYPQLPLDAAAVKSKLGIEPSRQIHLLFGDLNKRKGLEQILAAIAILPA
ncbi:MAG: glycosyltransferase family 1 protein, partial [Cyanobacteria bacterium P01_E01_bin.35]